MNDTCYQSGCRAHQKRRYKHQKGVHPLYQKNCRNRRPEGKAAIYRQIGKIQYFICNINAVGQQGVNKALCQRADNQIKHKGTSFYADAYSAVTSIAFSTSALSFSAAIASGFT